MAKQNVEVGDKAIDFTLTEAVTGQPLTLSQFEGRQNVLLIFFRGVW